VRTVTFLLFELPIGLDGAGRFASLWETSMGASFKDLVVWQKAVQLSSMIYRLSASFPPSEQFGLTYQMRRASVSISANIAEGYGRATQGEYVQFLGHARGSNCELQSHLLIANTLGFCRPESYESAEKLSAEISRMLNAMINKLKARF
jgi:four helix bundle protein